MNLKVKLQWYTVKPRFSAFQGTIHIYALKRGYAIAGIGFSIAKFKKGSRRKSPRYRKGEDEDKKKTRRQRKKQERKKLIFLN